jgi:type I restriction enzyme S subunit
VGRAVQPWQRVRLGRLFRIKHGFAFKGEYFATSGDHIVLTPGNFEARGGLKAEGQELKFYAGSFPSEFVLQRGEMVIVLTDLKQEAPILGSPAIIPVAGRYLHNQRLGKVTDLDADNLDQLYLYYLLNASAVRGAIRATATGTTVKHTAPERIYSIEVSLPKIDEQRKIARFLAAVDSMIEHDVARVRRLNEAAISVYDDWFIKRRFPRHIAPDTSDRKWEEVSFSSLATFVNGFAFAPRHWGQRGMPIVKIAELKNGVTEKTPRYDGAEVPPKYLVKAGDILFSWSADLDAYIWAHEDAWLNQHLFNVVPHNGIPRVFLYFALKEKIPQFRIRSQGTTMKHIKRAALDEVKTALPPKELRSEFQRVIDPWLDLAIALELRAEKARAIRELLIDPLLSGRMKVPETSLLQWARSR